MDLLIAGDYSPLFRVPRMLDEGRYEALFGQIRPQIERADYAIVNFESTIAPARVRPILKNGPALTCAESAVEALKWMGFDMVTLANNHFYDYGDAGLQHALDVFARHGLATVGAGRNLIEASHPNILRIGGMRVAILNFCEHEFGIATDDRSGTNPLSLPENYRAIRSVRTEVDFVVVIVHGGHEHFQLPSPRMQRVYRFFIEAGADAVINHHQHCFSGYERYEQGVICYGLGNFLFDDPEKRNMAWNKWYHYGYMIRLKLGGGLDFELVPYRQCMDEPGIEPETEGIVLRRVDELNRIIVDPESLATAYRHYCETQFSAFVNVLNPYSNRWLRGLARRGFLPRFLSTRRLLNTLNRVECESHRDLLIYALRCRLGCY